MLQIKMIATGLTALLVAAAAAQPLAAGPGAPWQEVNPDGQKAYKILYPGKDYPSLVMSAPVAPGRCYKLSWEAKGSTAAPGPVLGCKIAVNGKYGQRDYPVSAEWNTYAFYFYSGNLDKVPLWLIALPGAANELNVRKLELNEVTPSDFADNLVTESNFENCTGLPVCWTSVDKAAKSIVSVGGAEGFVSGEKTMQLEFTGKAGIQSLQMPVVLGKEFEFKFWAKADKEHVINVSVQAWSMFGHQGDHFYQFASFKITPEWQEYTVKVKISEDLVKYPDLVDRLMFVGIYNADNQSGKVWLDDISFRMLPTS